MKNEKTKLLKFIVLVVIFGMIVIRNTSVIYATDDSGVDGEIKWEISGDTLTLSAVEGTQGQMSDKYGYTLEENPPWMKSSFIENVKYIIIKEGITSIVDEAFRRENFQHKFMRLEIAGTITKIPSCMVRVNIDEVVIHEGVKEIDAVAFIGGATRIVKLPKSLEKIDESAFYTPADGSSTWLQKVYGYKDSIAEEYVEIVNKRVVETRENGCTEDGSMIGIVTGNELIWSDTALIEFVPEEEGIDGEIVWEISGDTLTLSAVEGTLGRMNDYSPVEKAPWEESNSLKNVKKLYIDNTVTELGTMAFKHGTSFEKVEIAGSIKIIPVCFMWGSIMDELIINEGVEKISDDAFLNSRVTTVKIPKSVNSIGDNAFCQVADGTTTYLKEVYGYTGSEAERLVEKYNKLAEDTRKNGNSLDSPMFGISWSTDGIWSDTAVIKFSALDLESEENIYELTINIVWSNDGNGIYSIDSNEGNIIYTNEESSLKEIHNIFASEYSEEKIIPMDITLTNNGEIVENVKCSIKLPVPDAWDTYKEYIKVLTVSDTGSIEVVASTISEEGILSYICFEPPHFSPYALYLDYNVENDTSENITTETKLPENVTTQPTDNVSDNLQEVTTNNRELDDTPKTGTKFQPFMVVIVCLVLVGVGILICPSIYRKGRL